MTTDELIQAKKNNQIPTLAEVAGLNLCDLGININYGPTKIKAPDGERWKLFKIDNPCAVDITLNKEKLDSISKQLREYRHSIDYYPPRYFKGQQGVLYGVKLDCGFRWHANIQLLDFGSSYGKVSVNGVVCDISHSGGTGDKEFGWIDYAAGWHLAGRSALAAFKSILDISTGVSNTETRSAA
jgi:hypothetical protein